MSEIISAEEFRKEASKRMHKHLQEAKEIERNFPEREFIPETLARFLCGDKASPAIFSLRKPTDEDDGSFGTIWIHRNDHYRFMGVCAKNDMLGDYFVYQWERIVTPVDAGKVIRPFGADRNRDEKGFKELRDFLDAGGELSEWDEELERRFKNRLKNI